MGRVGPACRRFVRYYRNRVFRAFFHALPQYEHFAGPEFSRTTVSTASARRTYSHERYGLVPSPPQCQAGQQDAAPATGSTRSRSDAAQRSAWTLTLLSFRGSSRVPYAAGGSRCMQAALIEPLRAVRAERPLAERADHCEHEGDHQRRLQTVAGAKWAEESSLCSGLAEKSSRHVFPGAASSVRLAQPRRRRPPAAQATGFPSASRLSFSGPAKTSTPRRPERAPGNPRRSSPSPFATCPIERIQTNISQRYRMPEPASRWHVLLPPPAKQFIIRAAASARFGGLDYGAPPWTRPSTAVSSLHSARPSELLRDLPKLKATPPHPSRQLFLRASHARPRVHGSPGPRRGRC